MIIKKNISTDPPVINDDQAKIRFQNIKNCSSYGHKTVLKSQNSDIDKEITSRNELLNLNIRFYNHSF